MPRLIRIRLPLHLPSATNIFGYDYTMMRRTAHIRLQHHLNMRELTGGRGFRQFSGKKGKTKKSHHKRSRLDFLQLLAKGPK